MTAPDDREDFARQRRADARALAADPELRRLDREVVAASDRHNYSYVWDWLGLPVIQMPSDIVAAQEVLWKDRPQLVIETGVARGGSLVLYASVLQLIGEGTVLGIDIDIRAHNRQAIEAHPLAPRISLLQGSSTDPAVVAQAAELASQVDRVMVVLDSNHTHAHVLEELRLYAPLVTPGLHLVVADTVVEELPVQEHRPRPWGPGDNPATAVRQFLEETTDFEVDEEVNAKLLMTSSRGGYLVRRPTGA